MSTSILSLMNTLLGLCRCLFYTNRNYASEKYEMERLEGALSADLANTLVFDSNYTEAVKKNKSASFLLF